MTDSILSTLEIIDRESGQRQIVCQLGGIYEAPNWSRDGQYLIVNHEGRLQKIHLDSGVQEPFNTGFANRCNNDHGISPDGSSIVISHHDADSEGGSVIYLVPIAGGVPRKITHQWPSYWHGWSPDGGTLAFVAGRHADDFKIYSIPVDGGEERQLTFGPGLDDGPDYSHDGKYIYFNRFRDQRMQIWRMDSDGQNDIQCVFSKHSDWFPHPSPDGKHVVFLRYLEDQGQAHPFGRDVQLMKMSLDSGEVVPLTEIFYGGQGSFNVPSWSPDSKQLAFISYAKTQHL